MFKDLTAEKFIAAHRLRTTVDQYVARFGAIRRKNQGANPKTRNTAYAALLGKQLARAKDLDSAIPPSSLFLSAAVYYKEVKVNGQKVDDIVAALEAGNLDILNATMLAIIEARQRLGDGTSSWPTLLKSQTLFTEFVAGAGAPTLLR